MSGENKFVIFIKDYHCNTFFLEVTKTMTIEQLKEKIREKGYNQENLFLSCHKIHSGDFDYSKTLEYYGIQNNDNFNLSLPLNGGFILGLEMADISNEKGLIRKNFSKKAPKWNKIKQGLNVRGKCENIKCKAYGKIVCWEIGLGKFNLVEKSDEIKCPICKREIYKITTCVFCKCEYKLEGKKKTKDGTIYVNTSWKRVEKDYEYYDPHQSGVVTWIKLIIRTKPFDEKDNMLFNENEIDKKNII